MKQNLNDFLKLISGEEKSNTNPVQIIKTFIVLKSDKGEN